MDYIKRMLAAFVEVMRRAVALRAAFDTGVLSSDYEAFLAKATGVNEQAIVDSARETAGAALAGSNYSVSRTAPNGQPSALSAKDYLLARSEAFKAWGGDWEALAELSAIPPTATKEQAEAALSELAGLDLVNLSTGVIAQINNQQRGKLVSNKALAASRRNGFTSEQHNAAAASIATLWKHSEPAQKTADRNKDRNIAAIKRFVAPFPAAGQGAVAYLTVKESVAHGRRIYSVEMTEMRKLQGKGGTPDSGDTTPAAFEETLRRISEKVNPASVTVQIDQNGEPLASEVEGFRREMAQKNYSISSQDQMARVNAALAGMKRGPGERLRGYQEAKRRFLDLQDRNWGFLYGLKGGGATAVEMRRVKALQALGELDALLSAFPPERFAGRWADSPRWRTSAPETRPWPTFSLSESR